ncbi:PEP-CTERM sorting domain-containing protein [Nitrosospira sp. Is2]|uniref:PEP-CTERM sorting domain-containing protein n=1 Tax=Nitrosospira sp. Is2 TaxID=3080532 RepID=UPI00295587BF|nr:PEP-CTERM sorting domain-containing protein [Nitrosospira sp. Is2]WON72498.1 PEP-CTERM sorting domain-containing protein [Nitrosospira sp. Is2]
MSSTSRAGNLVFGIVASDAGTGSLSVGFNASAHGAVVAVPEPESYAMLLAGLGLMGAVVQRRKKMGAV